MKKVITFLIVLALMLAIVPTTALAAGETVNITTSAELMSAIQNQDDNQIWNIAAGTYDIGRNTSLAAAGQTGWYFPIIKNGITIKGAGIDQTVITSTVYSANGSWSSQSFVSIHGSNVTLQDMTLRPKLDTNKAVEIMGKDAALKNIAVRHNNMTHESYLAQKGIAADSDTDYWEGFTTVFAGSIYFNPQNAGKDIGSASLDNVLVTQSWISCSASEVLAGTLDIKGGTTIDYRGAWYAPYSPYGLISKNDAVIRATGLKIIVDDTLGDLQVQLFNRVPSGAVIDFTAGTYGAFTIPAGVTVNVPSGAVLDGDIVNNGTLNLASGVVVNGRITGYQPQSQIEVTANAESTYTIIIPEKIDFGRLTKSMTEQTKIFSVNIEDALLENNAKVAVALTSGFEMKDQAAGSTAALAYKLFNQESGGTVLGSGNTYCTFIAGTAGASETAIDADLKASVKGRVTCLPSELTRAGSYSDTVVFECSYVS